MKALFLSVILPAFLIIAGIIMLLLGIPYGIYSAGLGVLWLIISFLIDYKEDEEQPMGMGRGRER